MAKKEINLSVDEMRSLLGNVLMEMNQEATDINASQRVIMNKICLSFIAKVMMKLEGNNHG